MSNAFVNFLKSSGEYIKENLTFKNILNGSGNLRDWHHAARLFQDNYYQYAPKAGWLYYITFELNPLFFERNSIVGAEYTAWKQKFEKDIGLLVKSIDLPRFSIDTETLNQYNRKVVIQKKINYTPVKVSFHDDMVNSTTNLWKFYYQYYYGDGNTGAKLPKEFPQKYQKDFYAENFQYEQYGFDTDQSVRFFKSITIHQLYRKRYTSIKLINPLIKDWSHDSLDQTSGSKMMSSNMTVEYEAVVYDAAVGDGYNRLGLRDGSPVFNDRHYDNSPSPVSIGGQGTVSILGPGGVLDGARDILGDATDILGKIGRGETPTAGEIFNTAIKGGNVLRNLGKISTAGVSEEARGVAGEVITGAILGAGAISAGSILNGIGFSFGGAEKKNDTVTPATPVTPAIAPDSIPIDDNLA